MCLFCAIAAGEIPSKKIYEDDAVFVFADIHPTTVGHSLVVPKAHFTDFTELDDTLTARIFSVARKVGCAALDSLKADGFNIGVNTRPAAGQLVMHAHVHVIPRYDGDGLAHWPKNPAAATRIDEATAKLAAAMTA